MSLYEQYLKEKEGQRKKPSLYDQYQQEKWLQTLAGQRYQRYQTEAEQMQKQAQKEGSIGGILKNTLYGIPGAIKTIFSKKGLLSLKGAQSAVEGAFDTAIISPVSAVTRIATRGKVDLEKKWHELIKPWEETLTPEQKAIKSGFEMGGLAVPYGGAELGVYKVLSKAGKAEKLAPVAKYLVEHPKLLKAGKLGTGVATFVATGQVLHRPEEGSRAKQALTDAILGITFPVVGFAVKKGLSPVVRYAMEKTGKVFEKLFEKWGRNVPLKELEKANKEAEVITKKITGKTPKQIVETEISPKIAPNVQKGVAQKGVPGAISKEKGIKMPEEKKIAETQSLEKEAKILRGTKGMTAEDIMKKYPNIKLKKDVPVRDIYGNKVEIPEGEKLTPYELKGNKILLQDGNTYVVSKNKFQNIKGQSVVAEGKPFAPELEGLEETIKEKASWRGNSLISNNKEVATLVKNDDGTWSFISDFSKGTKKFSTKAKAMKEAEKDTVGNIYGEHGIKFSQYTLPNGKNYREILIKAPLNKIKISEFKTPNPINKNGLWEIKYGNNTFISESKQEAINEYKKYAYRDYVKELKRKEYKSPHWDEPNVLAHIRMNERTYKGKKVAFLEELQSDWAKDLRAGKKTPTHPLLKKWDRLAIKRALKEAVDSGADYFAWINGEQTSARYNLATYLDKVEWKTAGRNNAEKQITLKAKDVGDIHIGVDNKGKIGFSSKGDWRGKKLDEVLGKGLADKIMEKPEGKLSGEGLKFGGEWAHNLYDKQVPNIVKDLTGAKPIKMNLGLPVKKAKTYDFKLLVKDTNKIIENKEQLSDDLINKVVKVLSGIRENVDYIVTKVDKKNGKLFAVPKHLVESKMITLGSRIPIEQMGDDVRKKAIKIVSKYHEKSFNFYSKKQSTITQQGIKLTPEIKARIRGEAPKIETSGKMFEEKQLVKEVKKAKPVEKAKIKQVRFSRSQMPVGEGKEKVSRLEQRIVERLKNIPKSVKENLVTYKQMNKKSQLEKAAKYVAENEEEAIKVLKGEKSTPKGLLYNSIYLAMEEKLKGRGDAVLLSKLASLRATRAGQEISILTELDPHSPTRYIKELKEQRLRIAGYKDEMILEREKKKIIEKAVKEVENKNYLKVDEWTKFIEKIKC